MQVLCEGGRDRLTSNIAGHLVGAQDFIQQRAIANFASADADYGRRIAQKIAALKASYCCYCYLLLLSAADR
jgi:catalase